MVSVNLELKSSVHPFVLNYDILGVPRNAPPNEIRQAYLRLARETHPDKAGGSSEAFQRVTEAFEKLNDVASRKAYDDFLEDERRLDDSRSFQRAREQWRNGETFRRPATRSRQPQSMRHTMPSGWRHRRPDVIPPGFTHRRPDVASSSFSDVRTEPGVPPAASISTPRSPSMGSGAPAEAEKPFDVRTSLNKLLQRPPRAWPTELLSLSEENRLAVLAHVEGSNLLPSGWRKFLLRRLISDTDSVSASSSKPVETVEAAISEALPLDLGFTMLPPPTPPPGEAFRLWSAASTERPAASTERPKSSGQMPPQRNGFRHSGVRSARGQQGFSRAGRTITCER